jgi:hypothetical protein
MKASITRIRKTNFGTVTVMRKVTGHNLSTMQHKVSACTKSACIIQSHSTGLWSIKAIYAEAPILSKFIGPSKIPHKNYYVQQCTVSTSASQLAWPGGSGLLDYHKKLL